MRRQALPKSGLRSNNKFMALLLAGNAFISSVAFEREVGDVLRQGTSVTSLVPYRYGKFLRCSFPGSQVHTFALWLSGFLSWRMSSFTFSSDATVNIIADVQECHATNKQTCRRCTPF